MTVQPTTTGIRATDLASDRRHLPQRIFPIRVAGMLLGAPMIATILVENHAPWPAWALLVFTAVIWGPLALLMARKSRDPHATELRNLLLDPALVGLWIALLHFNLLPTILLAVLVTGDRINSGIRRLWLRSLIVLGAAILLGGLLTNFAFQPATSMTVILASAPLLVIHTVANSIANYRLVRRVLQQNRQLETWSRTDALTGLVDRRYWQGQAAAILDNFHANGAPASLLILDLDRFKTINDHYGHLAGDAALREVGATIRAQLRPSDVAGRLGGDELVVVLPSDIDHAQAVATRLRTAIAAIEVPQLTGEHITASVGLAAAGRDDTSLAAWIRRADAALYSAKDDGRDRTATARGD